MFRDTYLSNQGKDVKESISEEQEKEVETEGCWI